MALQSHPAAPPIDIGALLSTLHTADLKAIAATAIDLLDARAGDCDLEDDDPAGDPLDIDGEHPCDDASTILAMRPVYGADQSLGPVNGLVAYQEHQAEELGLVRTARGTWARAA
ncbi:hypothetical protein [Sphingomonas adhaesiva]|uniref:hypothetical protein n=1 Tax=Sphingomonas adhaesiva TaxID=28212 RepID=UPI002FF614B5